MTGIGAHLPFPAAAFMALPAAFITALAGLALASAGRSGAC